jgi:hypothetical protein
MYIEFTYQHLIYSGYIVYENKYTRVVQSADDNSFYWIDKTGYVLDINLNQHKYQLIKQGA